MACQTQCGKYRKRVEHLFDTENVKAMGEGKSSSSSGSRGESINGPSKVVEVITMF